MSLRTFVHQHTATARGSLKTKMKMFTLLLLGNSFSQVLSIENTSVEVSLSGIAKDHIRSFSVEGLCVAPFTPFKPESFDLNLPVVDLQLEWLSKNGVNSAFVGGTTGESLSMTLSERKQLLEKWVTAAAKHKITVIAHVGAEASREAQELARHAQDIGAAAIGLMPPTFFKPATPDLLADFIAEVAQASPSVPVYYYHIDCMTGVHFKMGALLAAIEARGGIPNFRGIKFTNYEVHDFMHCLRGFKNEYDMLFGRDEMMLSAKAVGAKGFVGSTYNYMSKPYLQASDALERGDLEAAQKHQYTAIKVISLLANPGGRYGPAGVDVGKAILELRGVPVGPPRPPKRVMTQEAKELLRSDLTDLGFFVEGGDY